MASLDELLHEVRRVEGNRVELTEKRIKSIYRQLEKDLTSFIGEEYIKYADENGQLFLSYLDSRNKRAKFLQEIVVNVDSVSPKVKQELLDLVDKTYEKSYKGIVDAVKKADDTKALLSSTQTLVKPEVLKRAVDNNIEKLTLNAVMEKHRAEIIADIQQTLNLGLMNGDRYETMAKRIQERLGVSYSKASNIARTESHRNIESGMMDGAKETSNALEGSGLIYAAVWRTMQDQRVRPQQRRRTKSGWKTTISKNGANHQKMEGVTIKVGEQFQLEPDVFAECPGMSGTARNDCRCRCYLRYKLMTPEEFAKATGQTVEAVRKKYGITDEKEELLVVEELKVENFPSAFTAKTAKKKTQAFVDGINGVEGADPDMLKIYNGMGGIESIDSEGIPFKVNYTKDSHAINYRMTYSGELTEVKFKIPKMDGDDLTGQIQTTAHEMGHLIDMYLRSDPKYSGSWISTTGNMAKAIKNSGDGMSDEISALFKTANAEIDEIGKKIRADYKVKIDKYKDDNADLIGSMYTYSNYSKYQKGLKKLYNECEELIDYERRNYLSGVNNLQDIYDALSGGTYRETGVVRYGHGKKYYRRYEERITETWANYCALSITRPDLIDMLKRDKPELVEALEEIKEKVLKKVGGSK